MSEKPLTNKEIFAAALTLEAVGHALSGLDLNRLQEHLQVIEAKAGAECPLTLATTKEHLHHLMRLAKACHPIQEEMARAPKPTGGSTHGYNTLTA